jgi:hypothetical protein
VSRVSARHRKPSRSAARTGTPARIGTPTRHRQRWPIASALRRKPAWAAATVAGLALIVSAGLAVPRWMGEPPSRPAALDNAGGLHSPQASVQTDTALSRQAGAGAISNAMASFSRSRIRHIHRRRAQPSAQPSPSATVGGPVTRDTNCAPSPHACGFPDATNTGPGAGISLVSVPGQVSSGPGWSWSHGGVEISGAGTVFAGFAVHGTVDVTAADVTIRDDTITATGDGFGVAIRHASGTTIADCDISSPSAGAGRLMVGIKDIYGDASGTKVIGNNIWHTSTGVQMGAGLIQGNYIHDLGLTGGDHLNGTTSNGSTTALAIIGNTIFNPHSQTDAISLFEDFGTEANRQISGNLIAGGGYTLYGGQNPGGPQAHNIRITGNRFATIYFPSGGFWGPVTAFDPSAPGNVWSGNVWDATGQPVSD